MYRDISVLLVEDNQGLASIIDMRLSAKHFQVIRASDRITAMDLIDEADMLILDINLPNGDGKDLLRMWAKQGNTGPAMIITGYSVNDEEAPEAWAILRKPFNMDRLVDLVEKFVQVVRGARCCAEVALLKKRMTLMWITMAALGGYEFIVPAVKLIAELVH